MKELKQLLMLNRVDFKGCCEKTELLERVQRLWTDTNTCPGNFYTIFFNFDFESHFFFVLF